MEKVKKRTNLDESQVDWAHEEEEQEQEAASRRTTSKSQVREREWEKHRPHIAQVKEEEHLRSTQAWLEEVDELWKEVAFRVENEVLSCECKRWEKKAFMRRGDQLNWVEERVMEKRTKTKKRNIWRKEHALAIEAKRTL